MEFKRSCPQCNKDIYYKRKGDLGQGIKYNTKCKQCSADVREYYKIKQYKRNCPQCKSEILYTELKVLRIAERKQTKCKQCFSPLKGKGNKQLKKVLNVKHEVNRIYKKCKICSNLFYTTPYYRNKIYCSKVCYFNDSNIKNLKYKPKFNKKACEYFNKLNETLNWNGVHGLNEGEKKIRKYWVDYYEPKLNIVIEWDEKFHSSQSEEDMIRCLEIIKYTNCKFYRIDGETLEIVKIDKNGNIKKQKKDCWFRTQNI